MQRRTHLGILLILLGIVQLALSQPAQADWKSVRQVTLGTGQVLDQGELSFGLIGSPVALGLTPRLTLQSHLVLDLLRVVNVSGRYRLWEGTDSLLSATASFRQSFFNNSGATTALPSSGMNGSGAAAGDGRPCNLARNTGFGSAHATGLDCNESSASTPGEVNLGVVGSYYPNKQWALSVSPLFSTRIGDDLSTGATFHYGAAASLEVHWLVRSEDLLMASAFFRREFSAGGWDTPIGTVVWVHQFRTWLDGVHLMAGASLGDFALGDLYSRVLGKQLASWPVFPIIDLWWRR